MHATVEIEARAMAWTVEAGHHLRVVIADQDPQHGIAAYRSHRARRFVEDVLASRVTLPIS